MATVAELLARAGEAFETSVGLEALVAAWQHTPAVTLLEVVDRYERTHPGFAFDGDTDEFRRRASVATVGERGPLLRALVGPKAADTRARLEAIEAWGPDPRTSRAIELLLRHPPYGSEADKALWTTVFRILVRLKDPRFVAMENELQARWKSVGHVTWMTSALDRALDRLLGEIPELDASDEVSARALFARLSALPPAPDETEAALLADVYARPEDDGPRLVYADWLQERGDPRGAFIALQCAAGADTKREQELLNAHQDTWRGPLAPVVILGSTFRRGFPSKVTARFWTEKQVEAHAGSPAWATIDEISWTRMPAGAADRTWTCAIPAALNPRVLHTRAAGVPHLLGVAKPWARLEELTVELSTAEAETRFAASPLFPRVRKLVLVQRGDPTVLCSGWITEVTELVLEGHPLGALRAWLAAFGPTRVQHLRLEQPRRSSLTFSRGVDGALSVGSFVVRRDAGLDDVYAVPDGWLTAVTVDGPVQVDAQIIARKTRGPSAPAR